MHSWGINWLLDILNLRLLLIHIWLEFGTMSLYFFLDGIYNWKWLHGTESRIEEISLGVLIESANWNGYWDDL